MKRLLNVALIAGGVAGAIVLVLSFFFRSYRHPTGSMEPTIHAGEHVIMRGGVPVRAGDVVVFAYPMQPRTLMVKRVVAVGGERVELRDKALYVDGRKLDEPYVIHDDPMVFRRRSVLEPPLPEPYASRDNFGPFTVPPGSYFVLGDNRDRSSDSRYWGAVPRANVRGKVVLAYGRRGFRKV